MFFDVLDLLGLGQDAILLEDGRKHPHRATNNTSKQQYIHQLDDGVVDKYKTNVLYNMSFIIAHVENTLS